MNDQKQAVRGMKEILPVAGAGIIDGMVFGILVRQAGLGIPEAMMFSLLVNAGSSQFAALGLLTQGVGAWPVLISTALLNARHLLYGLSLGPAFRGVSTWRMALLSHWLNDETFALKSAYLDKEEKFSLSYFTGAGLVDYLIWGLATLAGAVFGTLITEPEAYGLDFAFLATFLGFLALYLTSRFYIKAAVLAAGVACLGYYLQGATLAVILGTMAAVVMGVFADEQ
ncbi:AzlC family ABC transporter permease [Brevibacillus dissolubilis]|uniref:AzlC family ABC transporter permease n=1 Tax=Brevibacillus dissolubilis TaxID=1844116 RepID=UPI0011173070|nr:AzlC family ABC transporter permease [Brevibacillus dissolubilis]